MNRNEQREQTRLVNAERNKTLRINSLDKALFLIAQNVIPYKVEVQQIPHTRNAGEFVTRQTFSFDYDKSEPYASMWQELKDTLAEAGKTGRALTPEQLTRLSKDLWDELEAKYGMVQQ